ncbi:signal peptidase I [Henriciella aquimarina]|uniref:signal peptidase I n=1 Tax=Henriciella aquimarina TaxID=545261 RepID=UPI000A04255A|nr:signal peptidase I [Henriciella aquimarina]
MSDTSQTSDASEEKRSLKDKILKELREWAVTLAIFIPAFYMFSFLVYEQRVIPSESMVPTLQVGDRVAVNKFAYGYSRYSLPWGLWRIIPDGDGRVMGGKPERGDVAVFMHPHTDRVMIKRIIGLPGDEVQMIDEQLYLNGEPIQREFVRRIEYVPHGANFTETAREYRETIDGHSWLSHQWQQGPDQIRSLDTTPVFQVPEGHYLFIGDNRDNSEDGRSTTGHCPPNEQGVIDRAGCELPRGVSPEKASVGFVPSENLIGRADTVLFSTYSCDRANAEPCMKKRLWRGL